MLTLSHSSAFFIKCFRPVENMTVESDAFLDCDLTVTDTLTVKPGASLDLNGYRLTANCIVGEIKTVGQRLKIVGVERGGVAAVGGAIVIIGRQEGPMKVENGEIAVGEPVKS